MRLAGAADQLVRQTDQKPGNSSKHDPCVSAKRAFQLGQLVQRRDHVEAKYFAWQNWRDRLTRWVNSVRDWQGKKLPYTLGVVDVSMLLYAIDYLGVGEYVSAQNVMQTVLSLFGQ